jgi:hypothetical protein
LNGIELSDAHKQYNLIIRGVYGVVERSNSLLKTTFKALRQICVCAWRIGAITKAALVLRTAGDRRAAKQRNGWGPARRPRRL